ncbi:MAG TPA: fused MFS/spermidine synthase [Opitutaceae bacterium]|nr:fused MFS/spermidine synthase [Opitutaceae bacterium]
MAESGPTPNIDRRLLLLAVGGLGVAAVMTQLALLRELLGAFSGNELVLGVGLGCWLLLTGAGTWLGRWAGRRQDSSRAMIVGQMLVAIVPLLQVVAVRVLRDIVFVRGAAVGVIGTVLGSLALLLPFCVVSGAMLTLACGLLPRREGTDGVGRVYVADTVGSIAGGLLFSFVLVPWFDHFALLCFPAALNLLLAGALAWHCRQRLLLASVIIVTAGLAAHVALVDADDVTTAVQHWGQQTVYRANSPYGRLVVTEDSGQLTFFENGVPVITTHAIEQVEETVHYAMSQRPDARKVLLVSGGVAGTAREILRYPAVIEVTYVELDPQIVEAGRRFLAENLADARIKMVATDGRRYVRQTAEHFDVVIVAVPDPSTSQLNRFYTAEFFTEVKHALAPGGVLAFGLGRYENYVSPELAQMLASAHRTLRESFASVCMIPGGRVFFLASDGPLHLDIAARLEQRGLSTQLVNRHYLDAMLAPDRLADLDRAVAQSAEVNTDFSPMLYYYHLRYWLSQFAFHGGLLGGGLLILLGAYLWRLRAVPRVVFASGFAASALEVVLLLGYQTLYGSLYRQVGLVVTVFMTGLAAGAWWANRRLDMSPRLSWWSGLTSRRSSALGSTRSTFAETQILVLLALALAVLAALLPIVLRELGHFDAAIGTSLAGQGVVLLTTLVLAVLVGGQFPLASAADPGEPAATASRLYTADLVGAALGALLVSTLLIPLLGVTIVCLLTAGLNLTAAALVWRRQSRA